MNTRGARALTGHGILLMAVLGLLSVSTTAAHAASGPATEPVYAYDIIASSPRLQALDDADEALLDAWLEDINCEL